MHGSGHPLPPFLLGHTLRPPVSLLDDLDGAWGGCRREYPHHVPTPHRQPACGADLTLDGVGRAEGPVVLERLVPIDMKRLLLGLEVRSLVGVLPRRLAFHEFGKRE